jgi:hypothetical protein
LFGSSRVADGKLAPTFYLLIEIFHLDRRELPPVRRQPEQVKQQVDVNAAIILQGDAGIGHTGLFVEMQREAPERRDLGLGITHFGSSILCYAANNLS